MARIEAALNRDMSGDRAGAPLVPRRDVKIESPGMLRTGHGRPTARRQRPRAFDVLVTITLGHHRSYIAFECRDRGRPVTIPDVEQFYEMCRKARVHNMVMVSSRGFAETAREEAANEYGIRCIDLNAVDSFDWLQTDALLCDRFIINRQLEWQLNAPDEA